MSLSSKLIVVSGVWLLLAGCSSMGPRTDETTTRGDAPRPTVLPPLKGGGYYKDDGPGANPPPNLHAVPDAVPKVEPLHRFANRPYRVHGVSYTPDLSGGPYIARGLASWYGRRFHGKPTSSGEPYDMYAMTAAHRTLPIPSYARVTNVANGRSVVVRINDRGPFHPDRIIDLSYTAAYKLDLLGGVGMVEVERILPEEGNAVTSFAAAAGEMTAPVLAPALTEATTSDERQEVGRADAERAIPPSQAVYLQLGAFAKAEAAQSLFDKVVRNLGRKVPGVQQQNEGGLIKVQVGPYASAQEADAAAHVIADSLGWQPYKVLGRSAAMQVTPAHGAKPLPQVAVVQPAHWLQLAAYTNPQSADRLLARLHADKDLALPGVERLESDGFIKVQAGPFASLEQAEQAALRLTAALGQKPYRLLR